MPLIKKTITIAKCRECGYEWQPRQPIDEIKMCPKCRTKFWNKPKLKAWQKKESQTTYNDTKLSRAEGESSHE